MRAAYRVRVYAERISGTEEARLRLRVHWNRSHSQMAVLLGPRVDLARWDPVLELCKPRSFHGRARIPAAQINELIARCRLAVDAAFAEGTPSEALLRARITSAASAPLQGTFEEDAAPAESGTVQEGFERYMREKGKRNRWSDRTYAKVATVSRYVGLYAPRARWDDVDEAWLYGFVDWLGRVPEPVKRSQEGRPGLSDSTVAKYIAVLRWVLRWADSKGMLSCRDYIAFRPKLASSERPVIFLDWPELMRVLHVDLTDRPALARVRDVFCFCSFTGLRWSDVSRLEWSDVHESYLTVTTQKTRDALVIELNKYSRALLDAYRGVERTGKVFPVISNQKMNDALKELMRLCGIDSPVRLTSYHEGRRSDRVVPKWQLIGTHAARRTFICNALMLGVSPQVVMQWTGHSTYAAMKPYIAVADRTRAEAMRVFDGV